MTYLKDLLGSKRCRNVASAQKSMMKHAGAGRGRIASQNVGEKGVAGSHYGSLAYADLRQELRVIRQFGKRHMKFTANLFRKWSVKLDWKVSDSKSQTFSVWHTSIPFCAMPYISDPRYPGRNREGAGSRRPGARKSGVQCRASRTM